jgi:hypothetical protein
MKIVSEFKCLITGNEFVVILNHFGEQVGIPKSEYLEIMSNIAHDERELWLETH